MEAKKLTILDNINGEIRRYGMSKEQFCKLIGIDRSTYTGWQTKGEIPATKLMKCASLFNCSLDYLVRNVDASLERLDEAS